MDTAQIGATQAGGLNRLALTDLDRDVRDWFALASEQADCQLTVDDMGNMFARRAGSNPKLSPIIIGSHLDTQPKGGKYDGILGVLGALEVVRTLNDASVETEHPIEVVNWTNEEGARFSPAMLSSGVFAGVFGRDEVYGYTDSDSLRLGEELERIGYRGDEYCGQHPLAAYLELHIEQGPILEAAGNDIGVVTGVQGACWYNLTIEGFSGHAGATPMKLRRDALLAAAHIIDALHALALETDNEAVATVGVIEAVPGSRNVVPGAANLTVDLRHPDADVLDKMESAARERIDTICNQRDVVGSLDCIWNSPPVEFDPDCIDAVRKAADDGEFAYRNIVSGAGHDAVYISRVAPTGMIFVPCEKGISHNEAESIEPQHAAAGAQTLANAVLILDHQIA